MGEILEPVVKPGEMGTSVTGPKTEKNPLKRIFSDLRAFWEDKVYPMEVVYDPANLFLTHKEYQMATGKMGKKPETYEKILRAYESNLISRQKALEMMEDLNPPIWPDLNSNTMSVRSIEDPDPNYHMQDGGFEGMYRIEGKENGKKVITLYDYETHQQRKIVIQDVENYEKRIPVEAESEEVEPFNPPIKANELAGL